MQALTDGMKAVSLSEEELDKLEFKMKYQAAKYKSLYNAGLMDFVNDKNEIDLELVRTNKDKFFRCIGELYPQANPVEELKTLASCITGRDKVYTVKVDEPDSMLLFRELALVATEKKSCVPSHINRTLKLDDGTSVNGFIPDHIPNNRCPGALSDDHARVMFIPSYARWDKGKLMNRWQALAKKLHIVFVVRSYEYEAYYKELQDKCSIFYLPDDTQWGIGYARYIIVKMMIAWDLTYGIMCDDSVCCRCEVRDGKIEKLDFKDMLTGICKLYSTKEKFGESVACISPDVFRPRKGVPKNRFIWKAPTVCQVLNLQLLSKNGLNFRPELRVNLEDLIFGLDCYEKGLKCLQWKKYCILEASTTVGGCRQAAASALQLTKKTSKSRTLASRSTTKKCQPGKPRKHVSQPVRDTKTASKRVKNIIKQPGKS